MRIEVSIQDAEHTLLVDEPVPQVMRNPEMYYLATDTKMTPLGMPVSFEIDLGPKGQGLKVRSLDATLLWVFGFNAGWMVRLCLSTDEQLDISLHRRRRAAGAGRAERSL